MVEAARPSAGVDLICEHRKCKMHSLEMPNPSQRSRFESFLKIDGSRDLGKIYESARSVAPSSGLFSRPLCGRSGISTEERAPRLALGSSAVIVIIS